MPTSSINSHSRVWAISRMESSDGRLFYQSSPTAYDPNDDTRNMWEKLRFKYCLLCKKDNIPEQYRVGTPVPRNLAIANVILLGKIILKGVSKWLKERF